MSLTLLTRFGLTRAAPPGAGPSGTSYYVPLTIPSGTVSSDLANFPVYVALADLPATFWSHVQANGGDLRVTTDDGTTRCPVELVSIDTGAQTGESHFLAPSIASAADTTFRLYYGHGSLTQPAVTDAYGRNAVWGAYQAVYHLQQDPSGAITDSTGNGHDLSSVGSMTGADSVTGKLAGQAVDFDGINDALTVNHGVSDNDVFAFSAWWKPASLGAVVYGLVGGDKIAAGIVQHLRHESTGKAGFAVHDGSTHIITGATTLTIGAWSLLHGVSEGITGSTRLYVNGAQDAVGAGFNSDPVDKLDLGGFIVQNIRYADGVMDEVRVMSGATPTAAWVAAEHTNQATPTTFYSVGSEATA